MRTIERMTKCNVYCLWDSLWFTFEFGVWMHDVNACAQLYRGNLNVKAFGNHVLSSVALWQMQMLEKLILNKKPWSSGSWCKQRKRRRYHIRFRIQIFRLSWLDGYTWYVPAVCASAWAMVHIRNWHSKWNFVKENIIKIMDNVIQYSLGSALDYIHTENDEFITIIIQNLRFELAQHVLTTHFQSNE